MASVAAQQDALRERFGFRHGDAGIHSSRSMMLPDLRVLLSAGSRDAKKENYRRAIVEENVLGKQTAFTRRESYKKLHAAYGLEPELRVFRLMRFFWYADEAGRPLLALLCAAARDPLLRRSAPVVLDTPAGQSVEREDLTRVITEADPERFTPKTLRSIGSNLIATWTQAGYLIGGRERIRSHPTATPATAAYALALGYLEGARGEFLFQTIWTRLLDAGQPELRQLALAAARQGWLSYRTAASVTEVRFPHLFTGREQELLREQG